MDTLDNGVHRQHGHQIMLNADSAVTALSAAIAVVGLVVALEKGLIAAVRLDKALGAELGF